MRCFEHIAKLIRTKRLSHPKGYSQSELSTLLGYKNGQFISNVERALCNVPLKMLGRVSEVLSIFPEELKEAILKDHDRTLENYLAKSRRHTDRPMDERTETTEGNRPPGTEKTEEGKVIPMVSGEVDKDSGYREAS